MDRHPHTSTSQPTDRFLKNRTTGRVLPWTEKLSMRPDMFEVAGPEPEARPVVAPVPGIDDVDAPIGVTMDDDEVDALSSLDQDGAEGAPQSDAVVDSVDAVPADVSEDAGPEPAAPAAEPATAVPDRAHVLGFTDKGQLEAYAREFGVELDKRKPLARLQQQFLQHFGLSVIE